MRSSSDSPTSSRDSSTSASNDSEMQEQPPPSSQQSSSSGNAENEVQPPIPPEQPNAQPVRRSSRKRAQAPPTNERLIFYSRVTKAPRMEPNQRDLAGVNLEKRKAKGKAKVPKFGDDNAGGSRTQEASKHIQLRVSLNAALSVLAGKAFVRNLVQFHRRLSFNEWGPKTKSTQKTQELDGQFRLVARDSSGTKYGPEIFRWLVEHWYDETYRPQSLEQLLKRMDRAMIEGAGLGKILACKLQLLGIEFISSLILNGSPFSIPRQPGEDVDPYKTVTFVQVCLIPSKFAYQAIRGPIDASSWQKTMKLFGLETAMNVEEAPPSPAMPDNFELLTLLAKHPDAFRNYPGGEEDNGLKKLCYGLKLCDKFVDVTPDTLTQYENCIEKVLRHGLNVNVPTERADLPADIVSVLDLRNSVRRDLNSQTPGTKRGKFFGDLICSNGHSLKFNHKPITFEDTDLVGRRELALWNLAGELDLEALDIRERETIHTENGFLQFCSQEVPVFRDELEHNLGNQAVEEEQVSGGNQQRKQYSEPRDEQHLNDFESVDDHHQSEPTTTDPVIPFDVAQEQQLISVKQRKENGFETFDYGDPTNEFLKKCCKLLGLKFDRNAYNGFSSKIKFTQISADLKPDEILPTIDKTGFGLLSL
uniref:Uncharacterized protein n=1 Tax=Panagrolaimus davidi TaxID=227884 RepID=A0A914QTK9_9BILA